MLSFNTIRIRISKFTPIIALVISLLVLIEIAFRHWDWFYDYAGWESPGLMQKMEDANKEFQSNKKLNLVTFSSSVGRGIDVTQWDDALGNRIQSHNFAYAEQRPERQNFLFQNYIYPRFNPQYVIYALSLIDCNGNVRAMNPNKSKNGPFWQFRNIRNMNAQNWRENFLAFLSDHSVLFRSRQRARFTLQFGPIAMIPEEPTIGNGVPIPTIRHQSFGPMEVSWALHPLARDYNTYRDYWIPDDGEIGQVIELGKFCRKNGVKFAVVEIPSSPYGHTNWGDQKDGYSRFTNALDHIASKGIPVYPLARDIPFDNTLFEDQEHMNRWGGQITTNYIYQRIIRDWFPGTTVTQLNEARQFDCADFITTTSQATVGETQPAHKDAQFATPRQVIVNGNSELTISPQIEPGWYTAELYAGDGSSTNVIHSKDCKLEFLNDDTSTPHYLHWEQTRIGISYTRQDIHFNTSASLRLKINNATERPVVLDTLFLRKRFNPPSGRSTSPFIENPIR